MIGRISSWGKISTRAFLKEEGRFCFDSWHFSRGRFSFDFCSSLIQEKDRNLKKMLNVLVETINPSLVFSFFLIKHIFRKIRK